MTGDAPRGRVQRAATDPPPAGREGTEGWAREPGDLPPAEARKALVERGRLMLASRRTPPATALVCGALLLLACAALALHAPPALAGEPSSVSVRVEGVTETKLLPTVVTTTTAPVVGDGNPEHACSGTSALGALQLATSGGWSGPWNATFKQYEIFAIEGETHLFEPGAPANYFWSLWVDDKEAETRRLRSRAARGRPRAVRAARASAQRARANRRPCSSSKRRRRPTSANRSR